MNSWQLTVLSVLTLFSFKTSADYYTSITSLNYLLELEMQFTSYFEKYIEDMEGISRVVNNTINKIEKLASEADEDPFEYYENPLNAFKIISRFVIDWQHLNKTLFDMQPAEAYVYNTQSTVTESFQPTNDDLVGASKGLARLQRTYQQKTNNVAEGDLMGVSYSSAFTASECYWLGRSLYKAEEYKYSSEWLMQARLRLDDELKTTNGTWQVGNITDVEVLEFLASSMSKIGKNNVAQLFNDELLSKDPSNIYGLESRSLFAKRALEERHAKSLDNLQNSIPKGSGVDTLFEKVCNGDLQQTARQKRDLRCRYTHNNVPFCFIAPFKKEELSLDPPVAYYHEVIYDNEIDQILNKTENKVQRSKVGPLSVSGYSDVRTSQNAWLGLEDNSFLDSMAQRLKDITGLSLKFAEYLQVANYGIGGHYGVHFDFIEEETDEFENSGNRILTALFYINDVELGGATAFPFLRLAVPPIMRSMVVWYNLHESLEFDYRTKHGGCPVLVGSKWICNEWFHEVDQVFQRPCGLERDGYKSLKFKDLK